MPAPDLSVTIAGITMKNPLTVGSGTYGHHGRFSQFFPVEVMGALVPKTIRTYKWPGNPAPRLHETPAGLHTSVGIPCNSWEHFLAHDVPILKAQKLPVIQSVIGRTEDEYVDIVGRCSDLGIFAALELNLSCPNLKQGGLDFGYDPDAAYQVVERCRQRSAVPVFAKLAPDYSSLVPVAQAVEVCRRGCNLNDQRAARDVHRLSHPQTDHRQQDRRARRPSSEVVGGLHDLGGLSRSQNSDHRNGRRR